MEAITLKFLRYVGYDTTSDESQTKSPTTVGQLFLANALKSELEELGASNVNVDVNGYLTATIPATTKRSCPVVGFIAHLDTSSEVSGAEVKPRVVMYTGEDIPLGSCGKVLSPSRSLELNNYLNEHIIVTDGNTLLGADDKAGIAEIMHMAEYFLQNPQVEHGTIKIAFTPDEEIGRGADLLDVEKFGADWAYTIDGGEVGELEFENFNAASASVTIKGINVHPGAAKGKMVNAVRIASEFVSFLPSLQIPECTDGYEGFIHLLKLEGDVESASMKMIVRDHDEGCFNAKKERLKEIAEQLGEKYPRAEITLEITDQYRNMSEKIRPVMHIVELAKEAMIDLGITPKVKPIRGGTDGANLSFKGLPCPNLFAGGVNFHSCYEFLPVSSLEKAANVMIEICKKVVNIDKNE
jgi:tripeptide aminopeptidase